MLLEAKQKKKNQKTEKEQPEECDFLDAKGEKYIYKKSWPTILNATESKIRK